MTDPNLVKEIAATIFHYAQTTGTQGIVRELETLEDAEELAELIDQTVKDYIK